MKKFTLLIFAFVGLMGTMEAQFTQPNASIYGSRSVGIENVQNSSSSVQELFQRFENLGNQTESIQGNFTSYELQLLRAHYGGQNSMNLSPQANLLTEGFDDITTMPGDGFSFINVSDAVGLTDWFQGNDGVFPSHDGAPTSYIGANFNNTGGSVINNFMITPVLNLENGDEITFWTRTTTGSGFPDRLEVRIDPDGSNIDPTGPADVGSYTELLLEINPSLTVGGYPDVWTEFTATVTGLTGAVDTRVAFRYWVTDAGPAGNNSDYIGIDSLSIDEGSGGGGGGAVTAYGNEAVGAMYGSFDAADPTVFTPISAPATADEYAGAIDPNDPTTAYVLGAAGDFSSLDVATGVYTSLGSIPPPGAENWTGLEFDPVSGTLYAISSDVASASTLASIDIAGVSATTIANTGMIGAIALAIDGSGNGWSYDISDDNFYSVDLTTGAATVVGPLGFDANFAQGMSWDPNTDQIYLAAFNNGAFAAEWRTVDTATGATTLVGVINPPNLSDMGWVSIPDNGGGGGGGTACSQDNPENAFENGRTTSSDQAQLIATDITVPADIDFTLNTITVDIWTTPGETLTSADITFYNDATGAPGSVMDTQAGVVPVSQTVIGNNFGFDISEVVFDITPEMLAGQAGVESTYWVSLYVTITSGSGYISVTTATIEGYEAYFSPDTGTTWNVAAGNDVVYNFEGDCEAIGGGGGSNDDCSGAVAVACGDSLTGETLTATDSGGNPAPDVFYKFTGNGTPQLVTVSLCAATDYDSAIRIFDDCDLANELAFNDDFCGLQSEVSFQSDGTSTYYIMVEGFGSNAGNFSLDVTCEDPLPNDDCSGAIAVSCGDSVTGSTDGATIDTGIPDCGTPITSPGVWYSLDDNSGLPGDITLSLCNGTTFDSKISVYTGDCSAPVCVDGNDDACGLQSEITFASDGNTSYLILIHSFGGATGDFTLDVTCTPTPPPNDMIVNSIDVDEIGFPYTDPSVAMPAATVENGNPAGCDLTGANGVWYNFVAAGDGTATASITTPGGASSVTFYTAPDENAVETDLTLVPQNGNQCGPGTSANIYTLAGQAYYVFVLNTGAVTDIVIDGTNLGVGDNAIEGFSYYPNPSSDVLNLRSVDNIESVSLYNMLGQRVLGSNVEATDMQLDVSSLSTGTYFMKVTVNGQIGTYKVLKD
jgi:hypothetical protein